MLILGVSASVSANLVLLAALYGLYQDADMLMGCALCSTDHLTLFVANNVHFLPVFLFC